MIVVEDVHFKYPSGVEALKGVSLTIKDGEFVAIMGQNGAGKTTLVKHFNGLLKPSLGMVRIDGVETTKTTIATLSRTVGFVFQNPDHQLFSETVEEEIAFALKNFGFEKETIQKQIAMGSEPLVSYTIPENLALHAQRRREKTSRPGVGSGLGPPDTHIGRADNRSGS